MRNPSHILLVIIVLALAACTPLQTVRPLPDFVALAVEPGDRVELVTTTGDRLEFEVTQVDEQSIGSLEHLILLQEIDELYVRSWKPPEYPCGREKKLGCSIPLQVKGTDVVVGEAVERAVGGVLGVLIGGVGQNWHSKYEKKFYDACVQHDFCYRHGYKTYDRSKEDCDTEFYDNMLDTCGEVGPCAAAAKEFHWAVREHAVEGAYQTETSTHCEYDGPKKADMQAEK